MTPDGLRVQSFGTLRAHHATLVNNRVLAGGADPWAIFHVLTQPDTLQVRAFVLLSLPLTGL